MAKRNIKIIVDSGYSEKRTIPIKLFRSRTSYLLTILKKASYLTVVLALILIQAQILTAFEGHVVNVTAKICNYSEIRSAGYWKNHPGVYENYLPQYLGNYPSDKTIIIYQEADEIFNSNDSVMRNKLEKQLLAMKFNIAHFSLGLYLVENEGKTLDELVIEADNLLRQDPEPEKEILENMKDLLDELNNLQQVRYCQVRSCVPDLTVIYPNGGETWYMVPDQLASQGFGIYPIQWKAVSSTGDDSDLEIDIWFCNESGNDCFYQIADSIENSGEYLWQIPYDSQFIGADIRMKVLAVNKENSICRAWDMSDMDFCPPLIDFTSLTLEQINDLKATYAGPKEQIGDETIDEEPGTIITNYPDKTTTVSEATFMFYSTKPDSFFQCKLNNSDWGNCSSPFTYNALNPGQYQFQVFATDANGKYDQTTAVYSWTIDGIEKKELEEETGITSGLSAAEEEELPGSELELEFESESGELLIEEIVAQEVTVNNLEEISEEDEEEPVGENDSINQEDFTNMTTGEEVIEDTGTDSTQPEQENTEEEKSIKEEVIIYEESVISPEPDTGLGEGGFDSAEL